MNSILLAVFGHYDSRGGTMAIPIEDTSEAEIRRAMKLYNGECFGIEEPGDDIKTTAYGMEARACDKIVHNLLYSNTTPAEDDFIYTARLWYKDELPDEDLEEAGYVLKDNREVETAIDGGLEPGHRGLVNLEFIKQEPGEDWKSIRDNIPGAPESSTYEASWQIKDTETSLNAQRLIREYEDKVTKAEKERDKRVLARAHVVTGPTAEIGRWNDDA